MRRRQMNFKRGGGEVTASVSLPCPTVSKGGSGTS